MLAFDATTQSVELRTLGKELTARISALDEPSIRRVFRVYLEGASTAMLGGYRQEEDSIRFVPRYPFLPGRTHRVEVDLRELGGPPETLILRFTPDSSGLRPETRVLSVLPSGDVVPANLLRMYVSFSDPMARMDVAGKIRLLEEDGLEVNSAFLEMENGLWDPSGTRLTLFLHPGRIKSGLKLHEELGLPLKPGKRYRLVVAKEMEDTRGQPLVEGYTKEFRVAGEDRTMPDVTKWTISQPEPGSLDFLIVKAEKPLDEPLFERLVQIEDEKGLRLNGTSEVLDGGTIWRFQPAMPWRSGRYVLRVGAELEDLAGNRPTRLFEEVAAPDGRRSEAREATRRFEIRSWAHAKRPTALDRRAKSETPRMICIKS